MSLPKLQQWYANQCDGEHTSGVHIDTLDNPGWAVINLQGTKKETASRNDTDWIQY